MIQVVGCWSQQVVTVIEILSPECKRPGPYRQWYCRKRNEYRANGVNLIEIDVRREGGRLPMGEPPLPRCDYYVLVCAATDFPRGTAWTFSVRDSLPNIPVPIRVEEPPLMLSLKACFDRAYAHLTAKTRLDYSGSSVPPLSAPDTEWARRLLANWQG
jgi:hypothetical protein